MVRLCTLRFLERTVARVTVTTLLQRGYSRQRNVGECTAEARRTLQKGAGFPLPRAHPQLAGGKP